VLVVVLLAAGIFGIGAARLKFATGQDSYLDRGTATAKANRAYQDTFGGESMFVLLTAKPGKTVTDLFTPANMAAMASVRDRLQSEANGGVVFSVLDPVTLLTWSNTLVTKGLATQVLSRAAARETDPTKASARKADAQLTLARALGAGKQSIDNPAWVSFLLHDNAGFTLNGTTVVPPPSDQLTLRRSLQSFIPDERHALFVVVLKGNASLDDPEGHADARPLRVGRDGVRAWTRVRGPLAVSSVGRRDRRCHLRVRSFWFHRCEAVTRHHLGLADSDRTRHRLRHPDSQPRPRRDHDRTGDRFPLR
jgi:hypothetical protein